MQGKPLQAHLGRDWSFEHRSHYFLPPTSWRTIGGAPYRTLFVNVQSTSPHFEAVKKFRFCRFSGLFEPIFDSFLGGYINIAYITPQKRIENWPKILRKATNPEFFHSLFAAQLLFARTRHRLICGPLRESSRK